MPQDPRYLTLQRHCGRTVPSLRRAERPRETSHRGSRHDASLHRPVEAEPALDLPNGVVQVPGGGFAFVCTRHQIASRTVDDFDNLIIGCPVCEVELLADHGRMRYRLLHHLFTAARPQPHKRRR
jgi:hypothetical protein